MNKLPSKKEMEIRREAKLVRAQKIANIGETLTDEQICELVPEKELVMKLPLFLSKRDGSLPTEEELHSLASCIRRSMAAEKVLEQRETNNSSQ